MTDKQTLVSYRMTQAEETLSEAEILLNSNASPRSVINRAYYCMFYSVLALFLYSNINPRTSKHYRVIGIFDKEFVHTGKIEKKYSEALHDIFEKRLGADYKDFVEVSREEAEEGIRLAREFLQALKTFMERA